MSILPPIFYNLSQSHQGATHLSLSNRSIILASCPCKTSFWRTMSEQQRKIYQSEGDRYEALVSREDHQRNIQKAIDEIIHADGLDILDLGAGTGRLTLLLAPRAKSIRAFD